MRPEPRLERAIVLQLLRDDHEQAWSREELGAQVVVPAAVVEEAVGRLEADGIVCLRRSQATASPAVRRLDELGLIAV